MALIHLCGCFIRPAQSRSAVFPKKSRAERDHLFELRPQTPDVLPLLLPGGFQQPAFRLLLLLQKGFLFRRRGRVKGLDVQAEGVLTKEELITISAARTASAEQPWFGLFAPAESNRRRTFQIEQAFPRPPEGGYLLRIAPGSVIPCIGQRSCDDGKLFLIRLQGKIKIIQRANGNLGFRAGFLYGVQNTGDLFCAWGAMIVHCMDQRQPDGIVPVVRR